MENEHNVIVHSEIVRSVLRKNSRVPGKKSLISDNNRKKRLEYAQKYMDKPTDFGRIFNDENKYISFGFDGKQKIWSNSNEAKNLISTVKHGCSSVMVWGCMSANEFEKLQFV